MSRIKTVKKYKEEGPAQFDVISRGTPGAFLEVVICNHSSSILVKRRILAPGPNIGHIKSVKRIKDDGMFQRQDAVIFKEESYHVASFSEDLIHGILLNFNGTDDNFINAPVNELILEFREEENESE